MERSPVAHFVRDEGVGGSNPLIPTKYQTRFGFQHRSGLIFKAQFVVSSFGQSCRYPVIPVRFSDGLGTVKIRLIPFSPQIQSVGRASMPDTPHPIYGTPYPSFPRRRESRRFPCGTVGEKYPPYRCGWAGVGRFGKIGLIGTIFPNRRKRGQGRCRPCFKNLLKGKQRSRA